MFLNSTVTKGGNLSTFIVQNSRPSHRLTLLGVDSPAILDVHGVAFLSIDSVAFTL